MQGSAWYAQRAVRRIIAERGLMLIEDDAVVEVSKKLSG